MIPQFNNKALECNYSTQNIEKQTKMLPKTFYGLMHDQKTSFVFKIQLTSDELFFLNTFKCHGQVYPLIINQTDRSRF